MASRVDAIGVASVDKNCDRGEPHAGERLGRSPGWSASAAGKRSEAGATDSKASSMRVRKASRSQAFDSPCRARAG
jgi:hypothetical protein